MQQKYVTRDRYVLLLALFIFTIGTYSLFANTNSEKLFEVTTLQNQVKGLVTDSNGIPIPGVTIQIKGTSTGTFTNDNGEFIINASPTDILILSYIGFKTLEVSVGNSSELSLVLQEDVTSLDEVTVNAGYYTVKERERTGSISKVTAEEIELQPIISPLEALQGRMAGVEIQQQNGLPNSAPIIRIRGRNSLRHNGNFPLYIVDGMPINSTPLTGGSSMYDIGPIGGTDPLGTMNLSNIKSIEILKDADATAIYGSRGANGVVLITTKKGSFNKKTKIELKWYTGLGKVSRKMKLMNTKQYLALRHAALRTDNREPNEKSDYDLLLWDQNRYTDWQEVLFGKTSTITDINVSATGGSATTSFHLGTSYHEQSTVFPGDNRYHKATANINLNHTSENKRLDLNLSAIYGIDENNVPSTLSDSYIATALKLPPNAPKIYNEDGSLHWEEWEYTASLDNPIASLLNRNSSDSRNNLIANFGISYKLHDGLQLKVNAGYTNLSRKYKALFSKNEYRPENRDGYQHRSTESHANRKSWIIEPQIVYQRKIGKGTLDGLLGFTFQQNESSNLIVSGEGFVSESLIGDLASAQGTQVNENKYIRYRYNAVFARLGYNWEQKYYINLTGRRDGSSRFGPDKRFANFWALGGAWIFSEAPFIVNNLPFLNFGKLRGSYGTTGSDQIGDYGWIDTYEATEGPNGLYPTQLTNPSYSWENNKKLEMAMELGFLGDRINIGVSWYRNRSSNQLVGYPLPSITGFGTVQANLPATVQNTGWEIEFSSVNVESKNFKWQTFINITLPNNELLDFPNIEQTSYKNMYRVGHPLDVKLLYQYNGINPETGLYQVVDVNEDDRLDYEDRIIIKDVGRKYFGGISNNLSYHGIGLSFLWEFVGQLSQEELMPLPGYPYQQTLEFFKKWNNGKNPEIQLISQTSEANRSFNNYNATDQSISKLNFLRLKTLNLSYILQTNSLQNVGVNRVKLFLQGQNLIAFSDYNSLNLDNPSRTSLPSLRSVTLGAQIQF